MTTFPEYSETCSYCFQNANNAKISITFEGIALCPSHIHKYGEESIAYTVRIENNHINLNSSVYEQAELQNMINIIQSKPSTSNDEPEVICTHRKVTTEPLKNTFDFKKCNESKCDIDSNLLLCLSCGYAGCSREQYGRLGKGHAKNHCSKNGHPIVFNMNCLLNDKNTTYCYQCDSFITNKTNQEDFELLNLCYEEEIFPNILKSIQTKEAKQYINSLNQTIISTSNNKKYTGICNGGNTCYMSCIFQLLALIIEDETMNHILICDKNPKECFLCAFSKILNALKDNKYSQLNVDHFFDYWAKTHPKFSKFHQGDADEFLHSILDLIETEEKKGNEFKITEKFKVVINKQEKEKEECEKEEHFTLFVNPDIGIENSLNREVWEILNYDVTIKNKYESITIKEWPDFLFINTNLYSFVGFDQKKIDGNSKKIEKEEFITIKENILYERIAIILHKGGNSGDGHYMIQIGKITINDQFIQDMPNNEPEIIHLYKRIK